MNADLQSLQAKHPDINVEAEYTKACAKYRRQVGIGWFAAVWLPRCMPAPQCRPSRADAEARQRDQIFRRAVDSTPLLGWSAWFAVTFAGIDVPAWASAPIDLRQRAVREQMMRDEATDGAASHVPALQHDTGGTQKSVPLSHPDRHCHRLRTKGSFRDPGTPTSADSNT